MIHIYVEKTHKYRRSPNMSGKLPDSQLNIGGKEKRGVVSFQCNDNLWQEYRKVIFEKYGKYKQSRHLESLIKRFLDSERNKTFG